MKKAQDRWATIYKASVQGLIWLLVILLSPLILVLVLCLYLWKYGVLGPIAKFLKPKLIQFLNSRDAFYATDRFWEDSRASLGMIVVLNGNVGVEKIRDDFTKKVLEATDQTGKKLFPRLTQIPISFGGYYFWQKANYFLAHEHIRSMEGNVGEPELKKFAGTVLTLPFPNKRPLWEILVFSSYKETCSVLLIRVHQAIADHDLIIRIITLLTDGKCYARPLLDKTVAEEEPSLINFTRKCLHFPKSVHTFAKAFLNPSPVKSQLSCDNNAIASWKSLHDVSIRKIMKTQSVDFPPLAMSIFTGALSSPINDIPGMKLQGKGDEGNVDITKPTVSISTSTLPIMYSVMRPREKEITISNSKNENVPSFAWNGFAFVEDYTDPDKSCVSRLQEISSELDKSLNNYRHPSVSQNFLKFLSIFPHPIVRYVNSNLFQGGTLVFHQYLLEMGPRTGPEDRLQVRNYNRKSCSSIDLIFVGEHELLDLWPLCGLQFPLTVITATVVKFQQNFKMGITIHPSVVSCPDEAKQNTVDHIVEQLPLELDKIFEDGKDEHGFVSIPII